MRCVFHTDSEKFSHALSVLNVLLADRCALSLALPLHIGYSARVRRLAGSIAISALVVVIAACSTDEADREHRGGAGASFTTTTPGGAESTTTALLTVGSTAPDAESTTSAATASLSPTTSIAGHNIVETETVRSTSLVSTGSAAQICSDAVTTALGHNDTWQGIVLKDETVNAASTKTRWLFCYGEGGSGEGVEALWSTNSKDWRFIDIGFGAVSHGGDAPAAVVFDDMRAAVSYDTTVGEAHDYAYTRDGGQTWTRVFLPPYPTPAP